MINIYFNNSGKQNWSLIWRDGAFDQKKQAAQINILLCHITEKTRLYKVMGKQDKLTQKELIALVNHGAGCGIADNSINATICHSAVSCFHLAKIQIQVYLLKEAFIYI